MIKLISKLEAIPYAMKYAQSAGLVNVVFITDYWTH